MRSRREESQGDGMPTRIKEEDLENYINKCIGFVRMEEETDK